MAKLVVISFEALALLELALLIFVGFDPLSHTTLGFSSSCYGVYVCIFEENGAFTGLC